MSLINQMLQDLDARRAAHGVGTKLPNDVRPLPRPEASRLPIVLGAIILAAAAIAGGFAFFQWEATQQATTPGTPASTTHADVSVTPRAAAPLDSSPEAVKPVSPLAPLLQEMEGSLRLADSISLPTEKQGAAKLAAASASVQSAAARAKPADGGADRKEAAERPLPVADAVSTKPAGTAQAPRHSAIERTDAVASSRDRADNEYRKAIAAVNQGRQAEALEHLRNALRQDSLHAASRQLLIRLLIEAKRTDEAAEVLQDGLQGQPAQVGWAMSLARLHVDRGDLEGAWRTLDQTSPAAGNNADYQGFMAHVLQRLGRGKEAARYYQAATRLAPGDGRWWLGLGLSLEADGRSGEAREMFLRARQSGNLGPELLALVEQRLRH